MNRMRIGECGLRIADCGLGKWNPKCGLKGMDVCETVEPKSALINRKMDKDEMKERTKQFALRVIRLVESLPKGRTAEVIGRQLLRSGTSVGANYRAACRAKSPADFIAKMGIVEEEADESLFWMELLIESGIMQASKLESLMKEADELLAITVASIKTARRTK